MLYDTSTVVCGMECLILLFVKMRKQVVFLMNACMLVRTMCVYSYVHSLLTLCKMKLLSNCM